MPEEPITISRYVVQQSALGRWIGVMATDSLYEADEFALAARAVGISRVRVWDVQLGREVWSVQGGPSDPLA